MRKRPTSVVTAAFAVPTLLCALALTPLGSTSASASAASSRVHGQRITFTTTTCAPRWRAPNPGRRHFAIANESQYSATIYLLHPLSGKVIAKLTGVKPHSTRSLVVRLTRGGHYMWGCDLKGRPPHTSDVETVPVDPTHGGSGPPVVPVTRDQLVVPMRRYRHYVTSDLSLLKTQVATLATDLADDKVPAAESAWLTAHRTWLRIGQDDGAYSAFGTLGLEIDGTTAGLQGGTSSPQWSGFHKVEFDLWSKADVAVAKADTSRLAGFVEHLSGHGLARWLPYSTVSVSGLPLRCHEILEDALRDSLSGEDDYGSGTSLASVRADVAGVGELLGLLAPLITPRSAHLVRRARHALSHVVSIVEATRSNGHWVPVEDLSRRQREAVDGAVDATLEILAPVPDLLTIGKS